jgi:hypothetical protein
MKGSSCMAKNVQTSLQIPQGVHSILEREARARFLSLNKYITLILADYIHRKAFEPQKGAYEALTQVIAETAAETEVELICAANLVEGRGKKARNKQGKG